LNQLVFIERNQAVTDSLTVAEVFEKGHDKVMRDIKNQVNKLEVAGEKDFIIANFGVIDYEDSRGRFQEKFLLSEDAFTLVAMSYTTPEAMKFKVQFIQAFKKMREQLNGPRVLSEREQLMASMKLSLESAEEIAVMKEEVVEVKTEMKEVRGLVENQITLDHGEQRRVQIGIASRIYELESDKQLRSPLFAELYREIRNRFGVTSYKDIKRKDMMSALNYIEAWVPRRVS
jgi:Rha family phage regulatory protein